MASPKSFRTAAFTGIFAPWALAASCASRWSFSASVTAKRGAQSRARICSPFMRKSGEWKLEAWSVSTTLARSSPPEAPSASPSA